MVVELVQCTYRVTVNVSLKLYSVEVLDMFNMFDRTEPKKIKGFNIKLGSICKVFNDKKYLTSKIVRLTVGN